MEATENPGDREKLWRWAAALIDPARAERLLATGEALPDASALAGLLRGHKVPLLSLVGAPGERLHGDPAWQAAWAAERGEYEGARAEFARVQVALSCAGIPSLLIKAVGRPPSFPYRSDNLDLLVHDGHVPRVRRLLLGIDYVEVRNVEEPKKYLFRKFVAGRSVGTVHLHECVGWGTGFMDEERLWERARPAPDDPSFLIPGPGDALLITIAHAFYEDKRFALGDLQRVLWCLRRETIDWDQVAQVARQRGWYHGLLTAAVLLAAAEKALYGDTLWPPAILGAAQELPAWARAGLDPLLAQIGAGPPWRVPFGYSKRHYFRKVWADRALSPRQKLVDAVKHTAAGVKRKLRVHSQRPFFIALQGIDGSGKTAHAEALVAAFQTCELRAGRSWSRLASSPLSARLLGLARRLSRHHAQPAPPAASPEERLAARRRQLRSPFLRAAFVWATAFDLWLGYLRHVAWPLWRGQIVVADRYVLDAAAELGQILDCPTPGRLPAIRLLRLLSPRPDLNILLEVPAEVAAARAATAEAPTLLVQQAALRRELAAAWGVQTVDNSQLFADVSARLTRDALRAYYGRFWTLINALFLMNPAEAREE